MGQHIKLVAVGQYSKELQWANIKHGIEMGQKSMKL